MEFYTFKNIVEKVQNEKPLLFKLEHDNIPNQADISEFEQLYHIQLPKKYTQFLLTYGGGYFGYANIYSFDKNSNFYLLNNNPLPLQKYLSIADNACCDYYAFYIENGKCSEAVVFYNHDDQKIYTTEFSDILEYLIKVGLKQQYFS